MGRNKNLSDLEMKNIEFYLKERKSYAEIGRLLNRSEDTIRKEIKNYKSFVGKMRKCSNCSNKNNCKAHYLCDVILDRVKCSRCKFCKEAAKICPHYQTTVECELLKKNRHVCNGCEILSKCKKVKIKYIADSAIKKHNLVQNISQKDLKLDSFPEEFKKYLSDLIKNGISPDIIMNTLPERFIMYKTATSTLYDYIDKGLLDCCNLDLRNKVSRVRYGTSTVKRNTVRGHQLNGRSIENFSVEDKTYPLGIAEFDCVEGIKGGESLFTIMIPILSLMLAFKITAQTQDEIIAKLDALEDKLGCYFYVLLSVYWG